MSSNENAAKKVLNTFYHGGIKLKPETLETHSNSLHEFMKAVSYMKPEQKQNYIMIVSNEDCKEQIITLTVEGKKLLSVYLLEDLDRPDKFLYSQELGEEYVDPNQLELFSALEIEVDDEIKSRLNGALKPRITINLPHSREEKNNYKNKIINLDTNAAYPPREKTKCETPAKIFYLNKNI